MSTYKMGPEWREPIGKLCSLLLRSFLMFFQSWKRGVGGGQKGVLRRKRKSKQCSKNIKPYLGVHSCVCVLLCRLLKAAGLCCSDQPVFECKSDTPTFAAAKNLYTEAFLRVELLTDAFQVWTGRRTSSAIEWLPMATYHLRIFVYFVQSR